MEFEVFLYPVERKHKFGLWEVFLPTLLRILVYLMGPSIGEPSLNRLNFNGSREDMVHLKFQQKDVIQL